MRGIGEGVEASFFEEGAGVSIPAIDAKYPDKYGKNFWSRPEIRAVFFPALPSPLSLPT